MTYIKIEQGHTDDARWLEAGAFALHVAALVYCDRTLVGGCIPRAMALRVSLAVPPERADAAITALVAHGFWLEVATGYTIVDYDQHASRPSRSSAPGSAGRPTRSAAGSTTSETTHSARTRGIALLSVPRWNQRWNPVWRPHP